MSIPNEPAQRFTGGLLRGWRGFLKQIDYLMSTNGKTYLQLHCICKFNFGLKYFTFTLKATLAFLNTGPDTVIQVNVLLVAPAGRELEPEELPE